MSEIVYVGMSGGVDSSVAAALLVEQGYKVVGVYMKNWSRDLPGMQCTWKDDYQDAKRVAVQLGIDLKIYDFETQYHQKVVDYMLDEYKAGRTPNPDVMCNQEIKFKLFLDTAIEDGATKIATGHYASSKDGKLLMARDGNKDQTYFLYRITEDALTKTLFPLSNMTKPEVREKAKLLNLVTAQKKESMGICFVGQVGIKEFLSSYVQTEPGAIINKSNDAIIGQHDGAIFYTIGQRHGLDVGGGLPYYVVGKDMASNKVYVTTDLNDKALWQNNFKLTDIHWINGLSTKQKPLFSKESGGLKVRTRHRALLIDCWIKLDKNGDITVNLKDDIRALTAGQSAVFYFDQICLGGGIII